MSTATENKQLPSHYEAVQKKAIAMGWDVERTPTNLKVIPPKGQNLKPFNLTRNPPMAPPQLKKHLETLGFNSVWAAFERNETSQQADAEPKAGESTEPAKKTGEKRVCPECVELGREEPFTADTPQGLALHRRRAHGVVGTSPDSVRRRAAAKKVGAPVKKVAQVKPAAAGAPAAVPAPRAAAASAPKKDEVLLAVNGLPLSVASPLGDMISAIGAEISAGAELRKEVEALRAFRDRVDELVHDAEVPPIKVVVSIHDLVEQTRAHEK